MKAKYHANWSETFEILETAYTHPYDREELKISEDIPIENSMQNICKMAIDCYFITKESIDLIEWKYQF